MSYVTSIGLDVHARSITAVAFDPATGEVRSKRFGYAPAEVAAWTLAFDSPKAVYESGVTGFHLVRALRGLGVDCIVGAVSKMHKPAADKRKKNDRNDAEFLARQLAARNIKEVWIPDEECEAARDLSRVLEDVREDLTRAKHRLTHLLIRHGYAFDEIGPDGKRKGKWTRAHWEWIRSIELSEAAARDALDFYVSEVRHIEAQKKAIEKEIADYARADRWRGRVEALRRLKGIETMTAFSLVAEAGVFSRFESARAFSSWLGLTPSEHSSGERVSRGGIIKAGNTHLRKQLVESSWHYTRATTKRNRDQRGEEVPLAIENHAARGREAPCREAGSLCKAQSSPGGGQRGHRKRALLLGMGCGLHVGRGSRIETR